LSIGAVFTHVSLAGAYEAQGITITPIQFGAHKTDGADFKPLDDAARADMQAEIDQIGEDFLATVAAGRGDRFTAEQARATQARVFSGRHADKARDALALGLVDAVMPEQDAFAALLAAVTPSPITPPVQAGPATETHMTLRATLKAVLDRPGAASSDDKLDARAALDRAQAILALPEAKGREPLAQELAFDPDFAGVSVDKAKATLAKAPLASRMAGAVIDPKISADGGPALTADQQLVDAGFAAAGVRPLKRR
jgi:ClpP class serine protease